MRLKAYSVQWKESVMEDNCVDEKDRIVIADDVSTDVRIDYPLFATKKAAEEFRDKSKEWEVKEVTIIV
jgi:hypothetical protein